MRGVLDASGAALLATGVWVLVRVFFHAPIEAFDEGVLLTGSMLVLQGKSIYRDFYTNYPPGIFLTISALWRLFGVTPLALRFLGLGIHVGLSLVAGRLAGRAGGRRFSWLAAGLVAAWLCLLMNVPYAWLAGLLAALVFVERLPSAICSRGRGAWVAAGLALGAVGSYRHDLFVYLVLGLALPGGAWIVATRGRGLTKDLFRKVAPGLAAVAGVLGLVWIPPLIRAGVATVSADVFFDQIRYVMPSRILPFPDLFRFYSTPTGAIFPAFSCQPFEGGLVLTLAGPALGLAALLLVHRLEKRWDVGLLLLTSLSLAVLPQVLGRTDLHHALFTVPPALILGAVLAERAALRGPGALLPATSAGLVVLLALPVAFHLLPVMGARPPAALPGQPARYAGLPESSETIAAARRVVLEFLDRYGRSGDPLFVGSVDHRFPLGSEMDLYFLADRTGATRYMQFDPGLVGRREVQEQMIRDLDRTRPAAAVLSWQWSGSEENESSKPGAIVLDEYLRLHYRAVGTAGPYLLLLRR